MSDRESYSAGINSPHNACMFRADCRQAEAEIARLRERDAEIARLKKIAKRAISVAGGLTNYVENRPGLKQALRELDELAALLERIQNEN
jgi:hypothetical protein